jgi:hypothetical protein
MKEFSGTVRMAKADKSDMEAAYKLSSILESIRNGERPALESDNDESPAESFNESDIGHHQHLYKLLQDLVKENPAFFMRIVGGLSTLLHEKNQIVDPNDDCIGLHPRIVGALTEANSFQSRVNDWMQKCFGAEISADAQERNHRYLEESLELVQSCGCTASEAHQLVDYVFGRPVGEPSQEAGGVMVTMAALCNANGLNMHSDGEVELKRIWRKMPEIRAKQEAKPKHSPLPQ